MLLEIFSRLSQTSKRISYLFDGSRSQKIISEFLEFLDIDEEHFFDRLDLQIILFIIYKKKYIRDNNQNLILEKIWFDSFDL